MTQLKITHEEARALLAAVGDIDTRNLGRDVKEMANINIVFDVLAQKLYDQSFDNRSGRRTNLETDGKLSLSTALERLIKRYKVSHPDRNWRK